MVKQKIVRTTKPIETKLSLEQVLEIIERGKKRFADGLERGFIQPHRARHSKVRWRLYNREIDLRNMK